MELHGLNTLQVRFEGVARDIFLGPEGFRRSLAPSLLEYFYHQKRLGFAWTAVVFFWGLLWSLRKTIMR